MPVALEIGLEPGGGLGLEEPGPEIGGLGLEMGAAEGAGWMGAVDVVGRGGALVVTADSTGGGIGEVPVPVPIGGGMVVAEALWAGVAGPGAAALVAGALGTADEGAALGVDVVELPFNPAPPSNLPAKHCVMSGTSVFPVGTRERT